MLVEELTVIFAAYGLAIGLVHLFRARCHWERKNLSHAVIVTRDAGATVEWHLRMLGLAQWTRARHMKITLIDEGSEDETVRIAERYMRRLQANWELIPAGTPAEARRVLERIGGEGCEVRVVRGPLAGGAGSAV